MLFSLRYLLLHLFLADAKLVRTEVRTDSSGHSAQLVLRESDQVFEDMKQNIVCIGNPGTGKSTILNGLVGDVKFKSGVSFGRGKTFELQKEEHNGVIYMDTPGLADEVLRKQAAEAIQQALKSGGNFRIIFVMTVESGRIRPEDKATMQLVLASAEEITSYGIIINKVTKNLLRSMKEDQTKQEQLITTLFQGMDRVTNKIHFMPRDDDLDDVDDAVPTGQTVDDVRDFINSVPGVEITPEKVKEPEYSQLDSLAAQVASMNQQMLASAERQSKELDRLHEMLEQQQQRNHELMLADRNRPVEVIEQPRGGILATAGGWLDSLFGGFR